MLGISEGHEDESDPVSVFRELWEEDIKNSQFAIEREELLGVTVICMRNVPPHPSMTLWQMLL